jgi:hypothetical protein
MEEIAFVPLLYVSADALHRNFYAHSRKRESEERESGRNAFHLTITSCSLLMKVLWRIFFYEKDADNVKINFPFIRLCGEILPIASV